MLDMSGKLSIMNHNNFDPSLTFYMYIAYSRVQKSIEKLVCM